ncbi:MAG: bifunctional 5,10-methylenetetrahydrofolate dehydrogenase/5,10-methenyltetrahydrofolate cyclohydrolase [Candidatus Saelkia tenebricola]|nr:bifunctional 5,10-methylenetetrahydrofolate dehydrogenase/5,10-methenyltetrahydrofolate cyclohydrolase [Candidatus Saelkia tenebricola]
MAADIIYGKKLAVKITAQLKDEFTRLKEKFHLTSKLVAVQVGQDAGSNVYLEAQSKLAHELGIEFEKKIFPDDISFNDLKVNIEKLNNDSDVDGIILMQPVPGDFDFEELILKIMPLKDVEGLHPQNLGKIVLATSDVVPPTAAAVMAMLDECVKEYKGREVVMIGHSPIVGKPLVLLLADKLATVRFCHIGTSIADKLQAHVREADILIVATGVSHLVKGDWIKIGAVVIDVGISKSGDKIVGDVEFEKACQRASCISPVPGGVGPVTTVMLMKNLLSVFKKRRDIKI